MLTRCWWLIGGLHRNLKFGSSLPQAKVERNRSTLKVSIKLSRQWKPKAGQYIKLSAPSLSWNTFIQWHPFVISWYEIYDEEIFIDLIIREKRGFTALLGGKANTDREILALIDGPYGDGIQLRGYGTVLFFASGIGVAGELLYAKQILDDYDQRETNCREVHLIWESNEETGESALIEPEIQKLEAHEVGKIPLGA